MRWDALFADMEIQLDAAAGRDRTVQVADLTRAERAGVQLADRLRAGAGLRVRLTVRCGEQVDGTVREIGAAWVLIDDEVREHLVPIGAVAAVSGLGPAVAPPPGAVFRGLGLGHALRALARDRQVLRVVVGARTLVGRIDAVGADHVDLVGIHPDTGRPSGEGVLVAFDAIDLVSAT